MPEIEEGPFLNQPCEGLPKLFFNIEPRSMKCREGARGADAFKIGQSCGPILRILPVRRNNGIAVLRGGFSYDPLRPCWGAGVSQKLAGSEDFKK